jgi:hypothetical protein
MTFGHGDESGRRLRSRRGREGEAMNQSTAERVLNRLGSLIGEWQLKAIGPDGQSWPGDARATIEWHDSGAHLVQRFTGTFEDGGDTIRGRWEIAEASESFRTDFDLIYRRVK